MVGVSVVCVRDQAYSRIPHRFRTAEKTKRRTAMIPGLDLDRMLDALADRVAERLRAGQQPGAPSVRPRLLSVEQAAVYIGRSKEAVQHMVSAGRLPIVRADRRVFLDVRDLDAWIEQNKEAGAV